MHESIYRRGSQYMVVAKRTFHNEFATFPQAFGVTADPEKHWTRLELALRENPAMRHKFKGWAFMVVRIDECIEVAEDGTLKVRRDGVLR